MSDSTLYTRTESPGGRIRYEKWGYEYDGRALSDGSWLIIRDGASTYYEKIEPRFAEVHAAAYGAFAAIEKAICTAVKPRTSLPKVVEDEAWRAFHAVAKKHGRGDRLLVTFPAAHSAARAGMEAIREAAMRSLPAEKPSVATAAGYTIDDLMVVFSRQERGTKLEEAIIQELRARRERATP